MTEEVLMALQGEAKSFYHREYMLRQRAGLGGDRSSPPRFSTSSDSAAPRERPADQDCGARIIVDLWRRRQHVGRLLSEPPCRRTGPPFPRAKVHRFEPWRELRGP